MGHDSVIHDCKSTRDSRLLRNLPPTPATLTTRFACFSSAIVNHQSRITNHECGNPDLLDVGLALAVVEGEISMRKRIVKRVLLAHYRARINSSVESRWQLRNQTNAD